MYAHVVDWRWLNPASFSFGCESHRACCFPIENEFDVPGTPSRIETWGRSGVLGPHVSSESSLWRTSPRHPFFCVCWSENYEDTHTDYSKGGCRTTGSVQCVQDRTSVTQSLLLKVGSFPSLIKLGNCVTWCHTLCSFGLP